MTEDRTIIFAGGGTGGHLYPGIAVAEALRAIDSSLRPLFLCTTRPIDRTILDPLSVAGYEMIPQPIVPPVRTITGLLRFWKSWRETKDKVKGILRDRKPVAVLGLGGYAAGVAVKLAAQKKIPALILNPDVIPGRANQYLMRSVREVYCQFEQTRGHIAAADQHKIIVTGCPIRADILASPPRKGAAARLGLNPLLCTLVITGASQGAQTVNDAVLEALAGVKLQGWQVLHLAGKEHASDVQSAYRGLAVTGGGGARVIDFTPAMADVWAVADLAISRSGASSCAELIACGVPSILFPYPYHKDMHQRANAMVLADGGAAVVLADAKDKTKNAAVLSPVLQALLYDAAKRQEMAKAARAMSSGNAAEAVAKRIVAMVR